MIEPKTVASSANLADETTEDHPPLAATALVSGLFLLSFQDSLVKLTSTEVSVWQFQLIRSTSNLGLLFLLSRLLWGTRIPKPKNLSAVALRSVLLVGAMICFFAGMPYLSLAEIAAGLYVFPLIVVLLSGIFLGERVGPRRILAVLVAFSGTLLILKPGTAAFTPVSLLPIAAAISYAVALLVTRRMCREESPVSLAQGVALAYCGVGAMGIVVFSLISLESVGQDWPFLFSGWHNIALWVGAIIFACSVFNVLAHMGLAKAYQNAEASWLVPFDYTYLLFATLWGYTFWREVPGVSTVVGMVMIAGAGTFVAWRAPDKNLVRQIV